MGRVCDGEIMSVGAPASPRQGLERPGENPISNWISDKSDEVAPASSVRPSSLLGYRSLRSSKTLLQLPNVLPHYGLRASGMRFPRIFQGATALSLSSSPDPETCVAPIQGWPGNPKQSRGNWMLPPSGPRQPGPLRCEGRLAGNVNGDSRGGDARCRTRVLVSHPDSRRCGKQAPVPQLRVDANIATGGVAALEMGDSPRLL